MILIFRRENINIITSIAKEVGGVDLYIPRSVPAEALKAVAEYVNRFIMPPSTWERLSKDAKAIVLAKGTPTITSIRGRYSTIDIETLHKVLALRKAGLSVRQIAKSTNLPKSTVHYILKKLKKIKGEPPLILSVDTVNAGKSSLPEQVGDCIDSQ